MTTARLNTLAALVLVAVALGGCASSWIGGSAQDRVRVDLLVYGVDTDRARQSTDMRWIRGLRADQPRDSELARGSSPALLEKARERLAAAPGREFLLDPAFTVRSGERANVSYPVASGSRLDISARPRVLASGEIEVDVRAEFTQDRFETDGRWRGVGFDRPTLRFGSSPVTLRPGEEKVVRLRPEIGTLRRPRALEIYAFVGASPVR
jgi:hypothetical protein